MERRLAAILAADVAGFSRLMGEDEAGTLAALKAHREQLIAPCIAARGGHIVKLMGDGLLAEFPSVVEAVTCAVEIQQAVADHDAGLPESRRIRYRIGINLGDVIVDGGDIYGDGVNVAARLEALAEPGGICVHRAVRNEVRDKLPYHFEDLGEVEVKNIARPVRVFRLSAEGAAAPREARRRPGGRRPVNRLAVALAAVAILGLSATGWWIARDPSPAPDPSSATPPQAADVPSIAVLPFENLSNDPQQDYFADGLTGDLITDLSKVSGLLVIARNSVFAYKGKAVKVQQIADDLGVRYVLEGSVRRAGDKVRINAQLIDAASGHHLWAERYDRDQSDLFALQDQVMAQIVSALAIRLTEQERAQVSRIPTDNLEAYDHYLRAENRDPSKTDVEDLRRALEAYSQAIALDPGFADAYAGYARAAAEIWRQDFNNLLAGPVARAQAYEAAGRALKLDPENARAYGVLAVIQLVDGDHESAIASARKAVALRPNDAEAHAELALVLAFSGEPEAAAEIEAARRIDPTPSAELLVNAGIVFYTQRGYDEAVTALAAARDAMPNRETVREYLAASLAHRGDGALARQERDALLARFREANLAYYEALYDYYRREEDRAHLIDGLRKAGVPDWPNGFAGQATDLVAGSDLAALTLGRTWAGRHDTGMEFVQFMDRDGRVAYRSRNSFLTGTAQIRGDMLCQRFEGYFLDRALCGYVFNNPAPETAATGSFVFVSPDSVKYFSVTD